MLADNLCVALFLEIGIAFNSDSLEVAETISRSRVFLLPAKPMGYQRIYRQNNSSRS